MSQAGARSTRGDEYQLRIALQWVVRLWTDDVEGVQAESLGFPGDGGAPQVDDVVVLRSGNRRIYIQAKKNQPNFEAWSLKDRVLREELVKARAQLQRDALEHEGRGEVWFYSQSPFGGLHKLVEGARDFPDYDGFAADAPSTLRMLLTELTQIIKGDDREAFEMCRRLHFTVTPDYDELDRQNVAELANLFAQPQDVRDVLERHIASHQARLRDAVVVLRRDELEAVLAERGHVPALRRKEADILAAFVRASGIGRSWVRDIGGHQIPRSALDKILAAIRRGARTIAVTSQPGAGKTCLLLDLADRIESEGTWGLLFIKGDMFTSARTEADLVGMGLPDDIVGQCARLAVQRPVVVVLDALDVLSLQRSSGALHLFLGLMDRLSRVPGVSVVFACRDFDLGYDPQLRGRSWDERVTLGLLDFDQEVAPILLERGVPTDSVPAPLQELLCVPQNLRLYIRLPPDSRSALIPSAFGLHDRFLTEVVVQDPLLGEVALEVLVAAAERMHEARSLSLPWSALGGPPEALQRLLSREVLIETQRGVLEFSHQELLDAVMVRGAIRRGETLRDFLLSRPPLPFLRPTVRVFFFMLRASAPALFRRQIRAVLAEEGLAYHLRRLVAESLAEVVPEADDVPLLHWMMVAHPDLFERVLQRSTGEEWLHFTVHELLPYARTLPEPERWTLRLLRQAARWVEKKPEVVLPLWTTALEEGWPGSNELDWTVADGLSAALRGESPHPGVSAAVGHLLRLLLDRTSSTGLFGLAPALRAWIESTDSGDDLLLEFLELEGVLPEAQEKLKRRVRALRTPQDGASEIPAEFLAVRLSRSDLLLDRALEYLEAVAGEASHGFRRGLLEETSWRFRHERGLLPHNVLHDLIGAVEAALKERAGRSDTWWRNHEEQLRTHKDPGFRYLAIGAYTAHPVTNAAGIIALLTDPDTFTFYELASEVWELACIAYPYLNAKCDEAHQALVLALDEPPASDAGRRHWRASLVYGHLLWIPRPYRTPSAITFLERWEAEFGPQRPTPDIHSSGGVVPPPISTQELLGLSDAGVLQVVDFWNDTVGMFTSGDHDIIGGWDQVVSVVRDAAMNDPLRGLSWLNALRSVGAPPSYLDACVAGVALHLRVRFDQLTVSGRWDPVQPLPDGEPLARTLLRLLELYGGFWIEEHTGSEVAEGCASALNTFDDASRLTLVLIRLAQSASPDGSLGQDPSFEAVNSTRGAAASAAVHLATRLAGLGIDLPELLPPLLRRLADDYRPGVRWAILRRLPLLAPTHPDLVWDLLSVATEQAGTMLWESAERTLYYNYYRNFDRVGPFLKQIRREALHVAGRVYGRIGTLAVLAGYILEDELFAVLESAPAAAWEGAAQVFATNLADSSCRATCSAGLVRLLSSQSVPASAAQTVEFEVGRDEVRPYVPLEVIEALLTSKPESEDPDLRVSHVVEWVADRAKRDALGVLTVLERLAEGAERDRIRWMHSQSGLVPALTAVLREADESDDPALIRRAIALQDQFLRLGVNEVEAMLDAASRP